jgi:prevent-host-death family protein
VITYASSLEEVDVTAVTASEARKTLYRLLDSITEEHEPVVITGKRNNAVLISEEDWRGIQETIYLISIPGMAKSIRAAMETPASKMKEKLDW